MIPQSIVASFVVLSALTATASPAYPRPVLKCEFHFEGTRPLPIKFSTKTDDRNLVGDSVLMKGSPYIYHENFQSRLSYQILADFETRRVYMKVIDYEFGTSEAELDAPFVIGEKFTVREQTRDTEFPIKILIECTAED